MTEQSGDLIDALLKISSIEDLRSTIPSSVSNKLADGDAGVEKAIGLLISLTPFAPAPATFGRDAFDNIVAVDYETGEPLPKEDQQKMLDVALEAGFVQKADMPQERYSVRKDLQEAITRVAGEE